MMPRRESPSALLVLSLLALLLVVPTSCGEAAPSSEVQSSPTPACQPEAAAYLNEIRPLLEEFEDTASVADSTPRASLGPVVQDLQAARRSLADVAAPDCAQSASRLLTEGMDSIIEAFLMFMRDESQACVVVRMNHGADQMAIALGQMSSLSENRPAPTLRPEPTPIQEYREVCVGMVEKEVNQMWYKTAGGTLPSVYRDQYGRARSSSFELRGEYSEWEYEDVTLVMHNACEDGLLACWMVAEIHPH